MTNTKNVSTSSMHRSSRINWSLEEVSFPTIFLCWFSVSLVLGLGYAAVGPGMIALFVGFIWCLCGTLYSTLWEATQRTLPPLYAGCLIALMMALIVLIFSSESRAPWYTAMAYFLFFLVPSYLGFWLARFVHGRIATSG